MQAKKEEKNQVVAREEKGHADEDGEEKDHADEDGEEEDHVDARLMTAMPTWQQINRL